jgi:hypothetical protein
LTPTIRFFAALAGAAPASATTRTIVTVASRRSSPFFETDAPDEIDRLLCRSSVHLEG